ncbi:MAG: hypothetical protein JWP48_5694 [Actinoallomurus sp.]|jgi:hypothetical protein|nr:hypothetical protein [Actinoallomurus sp.]
MRVLLHGEVPDKPGVRAVFQQHLLLGRCGRKPEPHANTPTTTTDKQGRERRFIPGLKTRVSTPRIR